MKVLTVLLMAVAVSARPEINNQRSAENQEVKEVQSGSQESASLPVLLWRTARELYGEGGGQIPVQLVYDEETNNRVAREPEPRRASVPGCRREKRRRRAIGSLGAAHQSTTGQQQPYGPSIVKLKVRRGGVAIAGPGGVATAGSGGTAIVGPGGTAYTMPDGTAVVGPGGRLIQLDPYVTQGRSAGRIIATGPVIYYPLQFDAL